VFYSSSDTAVARIVDEKVHITGAGTSIITAFQAGNDKFGAAAPVAQILTVVKKAQNIVFNAIPNKRLGDAGFTVSATASSGLPVSYSSSDTNVAFIDSTGHIHVAGAGTTLITASQPGNGMYQAVRAIQPFTVLSFNLQVLHLDGDNGQGSNNSIKPYLKVVNSDSVPVAYQELTVRYWFTPENYAGINTSIDYAQLGISKVKTKYESLPAPRNGAFGYVEYGFDSTTGMLTAGSNSGPIQSRLTNTDWSILEETNDYSYSSNTAYAGNNHITLYRNGMLVWGIEPVPVAPLVALKAYTENRSTSPNTIGTFLKMANEGNTPVDYKDLSVRYWFTKDGSSILKYWIDYVKLGIANIAVQFVPVSPALGGADTYIEFKVDPVLGKLYPSCNTGNIQYRITKTDWSAFNKPDDHSYLPVGPMAINDHVTVYYKGQLIFGAEPSVASLVSGSSAGNATVQEDAFSIYPNPVMGHAFSIKLDEQVKQIGRRLVVVVFDNTGRAIVQKQVNHYAGGIIEIPVNRHLAAGVYWVSINHSKKRQLIIMR
jgi:hypothetical protein